MMIRAIPVAVLLTLVIPPAMYVTVTFSSMTVGILLCSLAWIGFGLTTRHKPFVLKKSEVSGVLTMIGVAALLAAHLVLSNLRIGGVDFLRFAGSCFVMMTMVAGAHFAACKLERIPGKRLIQAANLTLLTLVTVAIARLAGVPAVGPNALSKAVVIFAEPSHFALAYLPILLFRAAVAKRAAQVLLVSMTFALALVLESLTLLAGTMLITALLLPRVFIVPMVAAALALATVLDVSYFTSRLNFSSDSTNLSTLVFLQGWDSAILDLQATRGLGVGFQQFGVTGPVSDIAETIADIFSGEVSLNRYDGSSAASKIIGEFGVLGIIVLLLYMLVAFRGYLYLRRSQTLKPQLRDRHTLFAYSCVLTYLVELYVRGSGYFVPGAFLMWTALLWLQRNRRRRIRPRHVESSFTRLAAAEAVPAATK